MTSKQAQHHSFHYKLCGSLQSDRRARHHHSNAQACMMAHLHNIAAEQLGPLLRPLPCIISAVLMQKGFGSREA
jgi:hypothetical protein